jgi:hypothetical protein
MVTDLQARYAADGVVHVSGAFAGWVEPLWFPTLVADFPHGGGPIDG